MAGLSVTTRARSAHGTGHLARHGPRRPFGRVARRDARMSAPYSLIATTPTVLTPATVSGATAPRRQEELA